jgi:hypothetical protein
VSPPVLYVDDYVVRLTEYARLFLLNVEAYAFIMLMWGTRFLFRKISTSALARAAPACATESEVAGARMYARNSEPADDFGGHSRIRKPTKCIYRHVGMRHPPVWRFNRKRWSNSGLRSTGYATVPPSITQVVESSARHHPAVGHLPAPTR